MRWRYSIFFLIFIGMVCRVCSADAQDEGRALPDLISEMESRTGRIFNYEAGAFASYRSTLPPDSLPLPAQLEHLFGNTPFEYKITSQAILVYLPPQPQYRICGRVLDQWGFPLPDAGVALVGTDAGVYTDPDGYFELTVRAYLNQRIQISYLGYQPREYSLRQMRNPNCPEYRLAGEAFYRVSEVIVDGYLTAGMQEGEVYSSTRMDYDRIAGILPPLDNDVFRSVQMLPGVSTIDESATNLQIRGGSPDQNLILWEGATLYGPGHFFGMISSVNPFVVDEVAVYKGAYDPSLDNRVGGVVDISLSDSLASRWQIGLGTTFSEGHFYLEGPLIKEYLSVLVSGRESVNGILNTPTLESFASKVFQSSRIDEFNAVAEEGFAEVDQVLDYADWNAKVIFRPFDQLQIQFSSLESRNDFTYHSLFTDDLWRTEDILNYDNAVRNLEISWKMNPRWTLGASVLNAYYQNRYSLDVDLGVDQENIIARRSDNDIADESMVLRVAHRRDSSLRFEFGVDVNEKRVNFNVSDFHQFEGAYADSNALSGRFTNLFGAIEWQRRQWHLAGGFRATHHLDEYTWTLSPRLDMQYRVNAQWKVKASAGIFHQYISQLRDFGQNDLGVENPVWILNPPELEQVMRATKWALGGLWQHEAWLVELEAYHTSTVGISTLSPLLSRPVNENLGDIFLGSSAARGADLLMQYSKPRFRAWLNYSLARIDFDFPGIQEEPFPGRADRRHQIQVLAAWHLGKWTASTSWRLSSGLPYSEPGEIGSFPGDDEQTYYYFEYEGIHAERLPTYSRVDLGIRYEMSFPAFPLRGEFAFSLLNVFNRENVFSREYFLEDDGEDIPPYTAQVEKRLLGITPTFLARLYW